MVGCFADAVDYDWETLEKRRRRGRDGLIGLNFGRNSFNARLQINLRSDECVVVTVLTGLAPRIDYAA